MQTSSSTAVVFCATAALSALPSLAALRPATVAFHASHSEWLSPHVGKEFFVSENLTVATERARTTALPSGAVAFPLAGVGTDFAWFENKTDRVSVPLASLRVALRK